MEKNLPTKSMTLGDKYKLTKECMSLKDTEEIGKKFRCCVHIVNQFKVDLITFIKDYKVDTYQVHFYTKVLIREIDRNHKPNPRKIRREKALLKLKVKKKKKNKLQYW